MSEEGALAQVPQDFGITVTRDPNLILAEASQAARALKAVLDSRPKDDRVMMNGKRYLVFEDWAVLAKFYGLVAKVSTTAYIELNGVRGFEAKAVAYHVPTGTEVSAAEAMCLNDEDKWSTRSKYEYKDGKREKVGDVPVPLFQLKSMAQTRACAKALKNAVSWVVVMAGYQPNIAEEMTGDEEGHSRPPISQPKPKVEQEEGTQVKTIVVEKIESKQIKKKNGQGTFEALTIHAEGGWKGDLPGFVDYARVIRGSEQTGEPIKVGFVSNQYGNQVKSAVLAQEEG